MSNPIGNLIDGLGVTMSFEEGELVKSVVVLVTVLDPDGTTTLRSAWSDGMSWVERVGMLRVAESEELS